MPDLPSTTLELAARAVLSHPWGSGPWSAHTEHRYDIECAVCQGDVRRVLTVALTTAADHAHQLASSHASEHDVLRQRYAEAVRSVAIKLTPNPTTTAMLQAYAPFHLTDDEARPIADAVLAVRDDELRKACLHAVVAEVALKGARRELAAARAAVARVRGLAERWGVTDPGARDEILAALDGPAAAEQTGSGKQLPALGATTREEGA